jgi:hypothetical protein
LLNFRPKRHSVGKEYAPPKGETQILFKKRQELNTNNFNNNEREFIPRMNTEYNRFPNFNDYNSNVKIKPLARQSNIKQNSSSQVEVKIRKKVKTAGDNSHESVFHTTFGSLKQASMFSNTKQMNNLKPVPLNTNDNPFEISWEETHTPTLPNLENQAGRAEQKEPLPLPKNNDRQSLDYSYKASGKAKSSCSLRKRSHAIQKKAFFTNDKVFRNIQNTLIDDR